MSMDESVRIAKFSVLVDEICDLVSRGGLERLLCERDEKELFEKYHIDASLLFIFDYEKANKFAQIIMEKCPITNVCVWRQWRENAREGVYAYSDVKDAGKRRKTIASLVKISTYLFSGH